MKLVERLRRIENRPIPRDFRYDQVSGLSREVLGKLQEVRPGSIGQASRIPGVTPSATALLMVAVEKQKAGSKGSPR
jgi:tRNA uridine 5-carboxymethylaminomethyl modification enzyme